MPESSQFSKNERAISEDSMCQFEEIPNDNSWVVLSIRINNGCNILQLTE